MLNNFWEEQNMNSDVYTVHEKESQNMNLPEWMRKVKCPFCHEELFTRSIRSVRLCLNARNFGDIALEVFCDKCSKMDSLYFRTDLKNISGFIDYLNGNLNPTVEPLLEEDMYKKQYNNIIERMLQGGK